MAVDKSVIVRRNFYLHNTVSHLKRYTVPQTLPFHYLRSVYQFLCVYGPLFLLSYLHSRKLMGNGTMSNHPRMILSVICAHFIEVDELAR